MGRKASTTDNDIDASLPSHPPKCLSEGEVLQPVSRAIGSDDWPIYLLKDAVVYGKDNETPANLLHAELEGPFSIRGKLVVDREYQHHRLLKDKEYRDCILEVKDVRGFSIGLGPITIWAMGKSGWFEIKPASIYQAIYDIMTEAIDLYYALYDIHAEPETRTKKKKQKPPDVEHVFDKYIRIQHQKGRKFSHNKVKKLCMEHDKFLLSQMKNQSAAAMGWVNTPFYRWLMQHSPDTCKLYKLPTIYSSKQTGMSVSKDPLQDTAKGELSSTQPTRDKRIDTAATIVQFMNELHLSGSLRIPRMTIKSLARHMYERFELLDKGLAKEIIRSHSKKIHDGLSEEWAISPIYQKLEILMIECKKSKNAELQKQAHNLVLLVRGTMEDRQAESKSLPLRSSPRGKTRSFQHNVLNHSPSPEPIQRKVGEGAGKGLGKGAGKGAGLRLKGTTSGQLKRSPTPDNEESDPRFTKRQKMGFIAMQDKFAEDEFEEDQDEEDDVAEDEYVSHTKFELKSTILPSTATKGPNGLWTCHKEACQHKIPNADEPDGRAQVQSHFLWHADEIAARENLVIQAQRPYLPISNLLDKLKRLGEAARLNENAKDRTVDGKVMPNPIKRRLAT